ncbi:MAG: hypothetical protein KDK70_17120 [Myxococcales bacterium]|nr:hypothetical protein [Myxococcales bacterium]
MTAAAADEGWIENSLARLEALESQREQLASTGQTERLAELDEEIRALYEVLESVAGDGPAAEPEAAVPMVSTPMAAPMAAPMSSPIAAVPVGMAPIGQPSPAAPSYDGLEDDIKPPRSPAVLILVGLVVIGIGVGAFMALRGGKEEAPPPEPTGPATVIKAGAIVEDTQEPNVAKGGEADRTRGTNFKESPASRDTGSRPRRTGSGGTSRPRSSGSKDDGRKLDVVDSKDPLAGVD